MSLQIRNDPFTQRLQQIGQWIAQGLLQPAAQALTEAQAQHPKDVRVALMGVRLAQQAGNLAGAVQAARRAVALEPGWFVAVTELALQLAAQGQFSEAMEHARHAVSRPGHDQRVLQSLAYLPAGPAEVKPWRWRRKSRACCTPPPTWPKGLATGSRR